MTTKTTDAPAVEEAVTFISKGRNFVAVRVPSDYLYEGGQRRPGRDPGERYDFGPDGRYTTSDPVAIEHLRSLQGSNGHFWDWRRAGPRPGSRAGARGSRHRGDRAR